MEEISIRDVSDGNINDLCRICIPPERRDDPIFLTGMEQKRKWAAEMLQVWGSFAKLAYMESTVAGLIQYEPVLAEGVVKIYCVYVPAKEHWQKGIATGLLSGLVEDMKGSKDWFGNEPALALVTKTFPGEKPGQYPACLFFKKFGFKQVGADPNFLYYPLKEGFAYRPARRKEAEYIPQEQDKGKALIIHGPSFCPFSYAFLKKAEQAVKEAAPEISVRWIDKSKEPEEFENRGKVEGCFVNAKPIKAFVLDRDNFRKEVRGALEPTP